MKTNTLAVTTSETMTIDQRRPGLRLTVPVGSVGIDPCSHSEMSTGVKAITDPSLPARVVARLGSRECASAELPVLTVSRS
jgi:hypothetical protein